MVVVSQLAQDSPVFSFIQYHLKQSLGASSALVSEVAEVSNPQLTVQFEKRTKGMLIVDSWVREDTLGDGSSLEEVAAKGIVQKAQIAEIKFPVGRIPDLALEGEARSGKIRYKYLLAKVAVGRSFYTSAGVATSLGTRLPEGYDSFVLGSDEGTPLEFDSATLPKTEHLRYVIREPNQMLPLYLVTVDIDFDLEREMRECIKCENCEISPASLHCLTDRVNLCVACDASLHCGKVGARHERRNLDRNNGNRLGSACRQHPDKLIEFYCPTCNIPVCVHCKMTGHHSGGESSKHRLVGIMEAYHSIVEAARLPDAVFEARRSEIQEQLQQVVDSARSIEKNRRSLIAELEARHRQAILDLQQAAERKFNLLRGEVSELQRRHLDMHVLESFLRYQQSSGVVLQFILDWSHYLKLKADLQSIVPQKISTSDVEPDLRLSGSLIIAQGTASEQQLQLGSPFVGSPASLISCGSALALGGGGNHPIATNQKLGPPLSYQDAFNETLRSLVTNNKSRQE